MALLARGNLTNVYASLDVYLQATLVTQAGLTLRLHGVRRFVPPVDTAWIEAHYDLLGLQSEFRRHLGQDLHATERRGLLQLNVYQRARVFTQRYTTAAARDAVLTFFGEGSAIPVYDWTSALPGTEQVAVLIVDGTTESVIDTGLHSGLIQHAISVATRYLEEFTRP